MSVMYILIGCSFLMALGFLAAFIWSVKSGQLDDDYTPSVRILFDDIEPKTKTKTKTTTKTNNNTELPPNTKN